jgi:hexokinase
MVTFMQFLEPVTAHDVVRQLTSCLDTKTLLDLACRFSETYTHLARDSTEHFLVTPVTKLPTGKEQGRFLAIDVGGSNLRVGFVELAGDSFAVERGDYEGENSVPERIKRSHDKSWPIGDHLKTDRPEELFRWIGDCMAEVVREAVKDIQASKGEDILLGVTFSFPMAYVCHICQ